MHYTLNKLNVYSNFNYKMQRWFMGPFNPTTKTYWTNASEGKPEQRCRSRKPPIDPPLLWAARGDGGVDPKNLRRVLAARPVVGARRVSIRGTRESEGVGAALLHQRSLGRLGAALRRQVLASRDSSEQRQSRSGQHGHPSTTVV